MTHPSSHQPPTLIIVMGVSGSGKSTLAEALADSLGYRYLDADDFHSDEAKAQMAAGVPLTDEMRLPWVDNICRYLHECYRNGTSCTLAFSGLRRAHRQCLRELPFRTVFAYLDGTKETIAQRLCARSDHFMPTSLLDSQFDSMEDSADEADVLKIDASPPISDVLGRARRRIEQHFGECAPAERPEGT